MERRWQQLVGADWSGVFRDLEEAVDGGGGRVEAAVEADDLHGHGEDFVVAAEIFESVGEVVECAAQAGVAVGGVCGELAVNVHRFVKAGQGLLGPVGGGEDGGPGVQR